MTVRLDSMSFFFFLIVSINCTWFSLSHIKSVCWFWSRAHSPSYCYLLWVFEKEMATHSSILAWGIPWMEEPGGLPSTGSHRVGRSWACTHTANTHLRNLSCVKGWEDGILWETPGPLQSQPRCSFARCPLAWVMLRTYHSAPLNSSPLYRSLSPGGARNAPTPTHSGPQEKKPWPLVSHPCSTAFLLNT